MMIKRLTITVEVKTNDRSYMFMLPYAEAPYAEVYAVLKEMTDDFVEMEKISIAAEEKRKQDIAQAPLEAVIEPSPEIAG